MTAPVAPWVMTGESLVALARCPPTLGTLPNGLGRMPGPVLLTAMRYESTPVGHYLELAVGVPARLGSRPGWAMTTMVVSNAEARKGGRLNWGFPKELGTLSWTVEGDERVLRWHDRDITVRGTPTSIALPFLVPVRALQRRDDGPVVVPGRLRGLARTTTVRFEAPVDDELAPLIGPHPGLHVAGMRFVLRPARHPVGLTSTLLAPLRAPEPALVSSTPGD